MSDNYGFDVEYADLGKRKKNKKKTVIFLVISACVFVAALVVFAILLTGKHETVSRIMDFGTALKGVKIDGTDVSGMSEEQALAATSGLEASELSKAKFTLDVNEATHDYSAQDMGVITDYNEVIKKALAYGHTGTFEERQAAADTALKGIDFPITLSVDENKLNAALASIKQSLDVAPREAGFEFMPWGYLSDGTAYQPDKDALIEAAAGGKDIVYPENIVRLTADQMPNKFRYEFWKTKEYVDENIQAAANIARFKYTADVTGISLNTDSVFDEVVSQVKSGSYSTIKVPFDVTEPTVKLADLQAGTQLITSWTSSYHSHYNTNRNWNVAKMSGIICGVVIEPGVKWSINDLAGKRTVALGWKKADGIVDGGYTKQPGGGVCQISSTLYNAAIRATLSTESQHHSISSGYIPKGLDATISSGGPDLKITNTLSSPVYIVSYMNPETESVTVEIYGPKLTDPATGAEVIYDYVPGKASSFGDPQMNNYYGYDALPDGTPIPAGSYIVYAEARRGMKVTTYKRYLSLEGVEYNKVEFEKVSLSSIDGKTYWNTSDPSTVTPTPTEEDTGTG
jgi:vancomycin resistance protein YoaR